MSKKIIKKEVGLIRHSEIFKLKDTLKKEFFVKALKACSISYGEEMNDTDFARRPSELKDSEILKLIINDEESFCALVLRDKAFSKSGLTPDYFEFCGCVSEQNRQLFLFMEFEKKKAIKLAETFFIKAD